MPTDDERGSIQEAHSSHPDLPLGPAEDFLFTLSSIPELKARLSLWKFSYAFQSSEEELAESLMDLKGAIEEVRESRTLKRAIGSLLCIGNVLNGKDEVAFELDYLTRVVDVKDTVHKTPLLIHLIELVIENYPDSTDLHSELSKVHRVAKVCNIQCTHTYMYIHTHVHVHTHTCTCTYTYTCTCTYTHIHVHVHVHTHIHIHTHIRVVEHLSGIQSVVGSNPT